MRHRRLVAVLALTALSCSNSKESTKAANPLSPTAPSPSYSISDLTAVNAGNDYLCGGSDGSSVVIDELTFRYANPGGRNIVGARIYRNSTEQFLGVVGLCRPEACKAQFEAVLPAPATACIVEGSATSTTGRITLFTRQNYQPTLTYGLRLAELVNAPRYEGALVSNALTASVTRLPGRANDVAAIHSIEAQKPLWINGRSYHANVLVYFYRPLPTAERRVLEVQLSFYQADGRLFQVNRFMLGNQIGHTLVGAGAIGSSATAPPWRVVVRMREINALEPANRSFFVCSNDDPLFAEQGPCTTDSWPAPIGPVTTEQMQEVVTPSA